MRSRNLAIAWLIGFAGAGAGWAAPPRAPVECVENATLNDVFFVDSDRGWAVGDRGAIWRTEDGGRSWSSAESPLDCRLLGVWFLDGNHGWAVGGWTHPYTHKSTGVVLRTQDGGHTWRELPTSGAPMFHRIRMFDAKTGWAVGAASALFPAGAYRTEDGGRGWASVGGVRPEGWETGDFRDAVSGAIAGRGGAALVGMNRFQKAPSPLSERSRVRQLRLADDNAAWLVGDEGLVLQSRNGGATWAMPPGPLPPSVASGFDFLALAVWRSHVWLAGSPGTRVFHSPDAGATWETFSTDQTLPLRAMVFTDEHHGWAVGELGTILVTRDGGRNWMRARSNATRVAVLGIFTEPRNVPWEAFVRLSGADGYLSAVEYLISEDELTAFPREVSLENRTREAMLLVGGCSSHYLGASAAAPQAAFAAAAESPVGRRQEGLVRKIRQWRPEVILTEPIPASLAEASASHANQAILSAVMAAEDPQAFPEHATEFGLSPWQVKKVYSVQPLGEAGSLSVVAASLAPQLGGTLADGAAAARARLNAEFAPSPASIELQVLLDRTTSGRARGGDIPAGLALPAPSEARRRPILLSPGNLERVSKNAQKQRNLQQILVHGREHSGEAMVGQVEELVRDLPDNAAGDLVFQMAEKLRLHGRPELAAELYQRLIQRYPQHEVAEAALLRLATYLSSSEAAAQYAKRAEIRRGVGEAVQLASYAGPLPKEAELAASPPTLEAPIRIHDAAATSADADRRERDAQALALGQTAARSHPALYAEPALRFSLAAAARRAGDVRDAERFFRQLAARGDGAWQASAQGELWFMKPVGKPPKATTPCPKVAGKPFLDGRLDDAVWREAALLELWGDLSGVASASVAATADRASAAPHMPAPATAYLARDGEYLYFAARCAKVRGIAYPASDGPRAHDASLGDCDRVELLIDLDRDYASYYRLTVDHRGWTHDACLEVSAWNPSWHVAATCDDEAWTVEAAIPWSQLTAHPPQHRDAWALGVQRIVPGAGLQSWTAPAALQVRPEGFGYLIFE